MIHSLLALSLAVFSQVGEPELKTFDLPEDERARNVFDPSPPVGWESGYEPVTLSWTIDDAHPEDEFIRSYLHHLDESLLKEVFADHNGPLLRQRLFEALVPLIGAREGGASKIYPIPSAGEFGIMLGSLQVPFAKSVENPETLGMTRNFCVTANQGAVLRHIAETLERYEQSRHDISRVKTAERMSGINLAWKNYLQNGYSQYPWELLINSSLYRGPWYEPPDHQFVVAHPEVGFSADVLHGAAEADMDAALMIHALGYVKYTGTSNDSYFGGSLSFMYDDDDGLAAGLAAHLGFARFGPQIPAFTIGVYWKDFDHGLSSDNMELGLSLDILRLFDKEGGDQAFLQRALQF